jgi:hypothetical protein
MHRRRQDPWKWPVTGLAVLLLLGGLLLVPAAWIRSFFSPLDLREHEAERAGRRWLAILPPPEIAVAPPDEPPPPAPQTERPRPPREDPDWWTAGWEVRAGEEIVRDLRPAPPDSAVVVLEALGLGADFMMRVRPDSLLARRLVLLRQEDSFRFDELKPYLAAMARARDYADLMSRAADMYGEHLQSEIMTPD